MSTFAAGRTRVLVVHAALAPSALETIRRAAPQFRVVTRDELESEPRFWDQAELLFAQHTDPTRIGKAKQLRWIQTYGAGVEWLLTPEVRERAELVITNARIHAQPIAEHVFGMILSFVRNLDGAVRLQTERRWEPSQLRQRLRTVEGATLGVLGVGEIGQRIAQVGSALGMRVIGLRRTAQPLPGLAQSYGEGELHTFLAASEYLVNALPLTERTRGLLGRDALARLPRGAFLVNIGRGGTIDTRALVAALESGQLGGAALDVTDPEPLPSDHALWRHPNVILTPHYAGAHPGYDQRATELFLENLARYEAGAPLRSIVDKRAGY